ncbi:MAG: SUMF1/EgtB/PvdO family nonheme iron enzyme [Acidobacteriota bacterium]|nr:SUMF1/EgtB/PvdO family nonheme iron enzyme [Acidobacteriota bacterium]
MPRSAFGGNLQPGDTGVMGTGRAPAGNPPSALEWYRRNRARSRAIFDSIEPAAYYSRPIALRNPIVFYEGHLPAFSVLSFIRRGLGGPPVDERLEKLFERGIDPDSAEGAVPRSGAATTWPSRGEVLAFADRVDAAMSAALHQAELSPDRLTTHRAEALYTALEHEAMHQETLLYMWHRLPYEQKRKPQGLRYELGEPARPSRRAPLQIPAGTATLGADRETAAFGWDNEFGVHRVDVGAFDIDQHNVTNADFLAFVESGGYRDPALWSPADFSWVQSEGVAHPAFWMRTEDTWFWRGMFEPVPLPASWPVYVSQAEASAYARWKGRRLPTEAEFQRAAFGTPDGSERVYPWGDAPPDATRGNFDFAAWEPVPAGARPAGASAWGVHDLVGNGWEWTSTVFAPFPGFSAMASYPEYSADFFDGQHYVMKGGSPATARELLRPSFRNWFRPNYPYVYATFRTVA